MSVETTVVATSSLQAIPLEHGQSYIITPNIRHQNVRFGIVAIKNSFDGTSDQAFFPYVFSNNEEYLFKNPEGYDTLYIYTLLRWGDFKTNKIFDFTYLAGRGDAVAPPNATNGYKYPGAKIGINLVNGAEVDATKLQDMKDVSTVKLPAAGLEFVKGYNLNINQGAGGQAMELHRVGKSNIEASVQIQVLSGLSGNDLLGVMGHESPNPSYFKLPSSTKSNFILLAFVAPHTKVIPPPEGSDEKPTTEVTFEIGDPEKDGTVGIREV